MHGCYVKGVFNGTLCWQAIADKKLIKTVRGFEIIWAVLLMNLSTPMMEEPRSSDTQADLSFHSHRKPAVISTTKDADTVSTTRNWNLTKCTATDSACMRRDDTESCAPLDHYAVNSGNFLRDSWSLKMGTIGCPETSVRNYHYPLFNNPEQCSSRPPRGGAWNHARGNVMNILQM